MANNSISYTSFTTLPSNISQYGQTVEEIKLQQGAPDANPAISPMPTTDLSDVQLALKKAGSDTTRLNGPSQPSQNPYEGPKSHLTLSRSATQKLKGAIVDELRDLIQSGKIGDKDVQKQMDSSLQRVIGMSEFLEYQNSLTDRIYSMALSVSKG